jgi:hypothetical protein
MRFAFVPLAALLTIAFLPAPAAALPPCGGGWTGAATCSFPCNDARVYVSGYAWNGGAIASLTVKATCGVAAGGTFTPLFTVMCSATGPGFASCANSAANPYYPLPLQGVCTVTGMAMGNYTCVSAP